MTSFSSASQPSAAKPFGPVPVSTGQLQPAFEPLQQLLQQALQQAGLPLRANNPIRPVRLLVAFSGGADSTALLHLVKQLALQGKAEVAAAFYNHAWRGTPPPEIARLHKTCKDLEVPLVLLPSTPGEKKTEAMARSYRYKALQRAALALKADAILTAHHADDQVETLLFRLFRGTGLDGLCGILPVLSMETDDPQTPATPIVRPLLGANKVDLTAYCQHHQLSAFEDPSNQNTRFSRNALRHKVLPGLMQAFPQLKTALLRLAQTAQSDSQLLDELLEPQWQRLFYVDETQPGGWKLNAQAFAQLGEAYQRRLARRLLKHLHHEADWDTVEALTGFLSGKTTRLLSWEATEKPLKFSLSPNQSQSRRFIVLHQGQAWEETQAIIEKPSNDKTSVQAFEPVFFPLPNAVEADTLVTLANPQTQQLQALTASVVVKPSQRVPEEFPEPTGDTLLLHCPEDWPENPKTATKNGTEPRPLVLRTRQPGDRWQPLGLYEGSQKLKDTLMARGIPQAERDGLLVLARTGQDAQEVLWVVGVGLSEKLRVTEGRLATHQLSLSPALQTPDSVAVLG